MMMIMMMIMMVMMKATIDLSRKQVPNRGIMTWLCLLFLVPIANVGR